MAAFGNFNLPSTALKPTSSGRLYRTASKLPELASSPSLQIRAAVVLAPAAAVLQSRNSNGNKQPSILFMFLHFLYGY